ncbi:MAG: S4 domain-containing protein YaaA [Erysipelothrix sp.]|nr:S4 domain-containing protein YaaA [Erysipelothrix sp.]
MKINTEYITLGQLLKFAGIAMSGGDIKYLLNETDILVNDEVERRRGRKLYPKDVVIVNERKITIEYDK